MSNRPMILSIIPNTNVQTCDDTLHNTEECGPTVNKYTYNHQQISPTNTIPSTTHSYIHFDHFNTSKGDQQKIYQFQPTQYKIETNTTESEGLDTQYQNTQQHIIRMAHSQPEVDQKKMITLQNRQRQRKHVEKTKPFKQLAFIQNPDERLVELILISYNELQHVPKYTIHLEIDHFMSYMKSKYTKHN